jgi:uncharacterized membrane protein
MQTMTTRAKFGWGLMTLGVGLLVLFSLRYFLAGSEAYFPRQEATYKAHELGLLLHIGGMMVAILMGPLQFVRSFRDNHRGVHRGMGKVYFVAGTVGALGGFYMAFYSASDAWSGAGFALLAIGVLSTNAMAFAAIRRRDINTHREWVTRSFAFMLAAVTLRVYMMPLEMTFGEYTGYAIVAWACWVPNILVAELAIRRQRPRIPARPSGLATASAA